LRSDRVYDCLNRRDGYTCVLDHSADIAYDEDEDEIAAMYDPHNSPPPVHRDPAPARAIAADAIHDHQFDGEDTRVICL
jgi:hypothetical protein